MDVLAHPFRFTGGRAAVHDADGRADVEQRIAVLITTLPGERPLVPSFGTPDPAFVGCDVHAVNAGLALHGPAVQIDRVVHDGPGSGYLVVDRFAYSPQGLPS